MSFSMDTNTSRALMIGASKFPKDSNLKASGQVSNNLARFTEILSNEKIVGLSPQQIVTLENTHDNTAIKEQLALSAEKGGSTFIVYYSGNIVIRKGQLYLTTTNSSLRQVHVNGIPLAEVMTILGESETTQKVLILDVAYIHSVNDPKEDTDKLIKSIFNHYEQEYPDTYFVSSPTNNYTPEDTPNFTTQLTKVLEKGIPEEKGTLSLQDLYDALSTLSEQENNIGFPVFGKKGRKSTITFAYNHQFIRFKDLRKQADKLFEDGEYQEALPLYREASGLFPEHDYISRKLQFTSHFLLASELFAQKEYAEAKKNFEEARNFFDLPIITERVNDCIEKLASQLYDQGDYTQALPYYEYLVKKSDNNIFYNRRLKVCQDEIRFTELVDKADRAYFEDNYTLALQCYNAALEINMDHLLVRRKEECERFLQKERSLKSKVEIEIREKLIKQQAQLVEQKIEEEKQRLKEKFKKKEVEALAKARTEAEQAYRQQLEDAVQAKTEELESSFWKRLSVWNEIEGYTFYLDFFPEGKYVQKAQKRIEQLKTKKHKEQENTNITHIPYAEKDPETPGYLNGSHIATEKESIQPSTEETPPTAREDRENSAQVERISLADLIRNRPEEETTLESLSEESEEITQEASTEETPTLEETSAEVMGTNTEEQTPQEETSALQEVDDIPQNASEEELWEYACSKHTVASYMNYINNTQESRYIAEAYTKVGELSRLEAEDEEETAHTTTHTYETSEETSVDEDTENFTQETETVNYATEEEPTAEEQHTYTPEEETPPTTSAEETTETFTGSEDEMWAHAERENTVASYMNYIENTTDGNYISEAYYRINQLNNPSDDEDTSDYSSDSTTQETVLDEEPSTQNSVEESEEEDTPYMQNGHQESNYTSIESASGNSMQSQAEEEPTFTAVEEEQEPMGETEEKTLWERAKAEDTVSAYFTYMNNTTEKQYWDLAKERISELKNDSQSQELNDWNTAQQEDTVEAYKKYIRKYPLGNYYAKAMFRLNRLES